MMIKIDAIFTECLWEVTVRKPACTRNSVTEVEHYASSSPPSPSPALKRVGYSIPGEQREFLKNSEHNPA